MLSLLVNWRRMSCDIKVKLKIKECDSAYKWNFNNGT